jgi:hypothetical protein
MRPHRRPRRGRLLRASLCVCVGGGSIVSGDERHASMLSGFGVVLKVEVLSAGCNCEANAVVREGRWMVAGSGMCRGSVRSRCCHGGQVVPKC